jgi:hypothetical protein
MTAFSPKACGLTLARRRFLADHALQKVGRADRASVSDRQP